MESKVKSKIYKYLFPVVIISAIIFAFRYCGKQDKHIGHPRDYDAIIKDGVLRVATEYNSISFYVDGDTVSGFNYELIQAFARDKGLKAEITPEMSFEERLKGLSEGRYDVIAYGILATSEFKDSLLLTSPIILNKQVLVQRKESEENDSLYIRNQLDLAGRTLHIVKGSPSILRIRNLGNEIGDTIYVKEIERYGPEQLISMVAHGDIDYLVCDESIAEAVIDSLPQIDIHTDISFTQFYSWAVSKQSPILLDSLNAWLDKFQKEKEYQEIYHKYYKQ
ncbi:transporter substrate-binding domain-containing protein [Bacteroides sp.]|uniref:transporter substrate-binding domain-containing protein n=1 Tax=Bacteroides sp. TaxID=29523 RepID=UPI0026245594|nr:transporter substrate-binding domain-containing protein [Bacteroides sp.]MDD3037582.1 transporter substrate-binding domain-containing protein [Bacteroides sp.]